MQEKNDSTTVEENLQEPPEILAKLQQLRETSETNNQNVRELSTEEKIAQIAPDLVGELRQLKEELGTTNQELVERLDKLALHFVIYHESMQNTNSEFWKETYFNSFLNESRSLLRDMERSTATKIILSVARFITALLTALVIGLVSGVVCTFLGNLIAPAVGSIAGSAATIMGALFGFILGNIIADLVLNAITDGIDSARGKQTKSLSFFEAAKERKTDLNMTEVFRDLIQVLHQADKVVDASAISEEGSEERDGYTPLSPATTFG